MFPLCKYLEYAWKQVWKQSKDVLKWEKQSEEAPTTADSAQILFSVFFGFDQTDWRGFWKLS